jgi:hypothetical protein
MRRYTASRKFQAMVQRTAIHSRSELSCLRSNRLIPSRKLKDIARRLKWSDDKAVII